MPGKLLLVLERIIKAQTTESEKTDTQVSSVYISVASVKEKRVRFSAQLRIRSASAAYNALPCKKCMPQSVLDSLDMWKLNKQTVPHVNPGKCVSYKQEFEF